MTTPTPSLHVRGSDSPDQEDLDRADPRQDSSAGAARASTSRGACGWAAPRSANRPPDRGDCLRRHGSRASRTLSERICVRGGVGRHRLRRTRSGELRAARSCRPRDSRSCARRHRTGDRVGDVPAARSAGRGETRPGRTHRQPDGHDGYGRSTVRSPGTSAWVQIPSTSAKRIVLGMTAIAPALISATSDGSSAR